MTKYYCHICDKMDDYMHTREHFNWEEYATPKEIALAQDRRMSWHSFVRSKLK